MPWCLRGKKKMRTKSKQSGLTLTEMTVVVASIVLLAAIALPAIRAFFNSFETESGAKTMISAALSSAHAIALKERRYAGIRFQKAYNPYNPDPLTAPQYMIFIIYDPCIPPSVQGNLGCRVVKGLKPIKLPDNIAVMDLLLGSNGDAIVDTDAEMNDPRRLGLVDATTFSILFSPSGKLVLHIHKAQQSGPDDDVFNTKNYIESRAMQGNRAAIFIEDTEQGQPSDPFLVCIQPIDESSRSNFIIYDARKFKQACDRNQPYSGYLYTLIPEAIYINPYTGTIISTD